MDDGTLYGPMHSKVGVEGYLKTLSDVKELGGKIEFGGKVIEREGNYVEPTIVTGLAHDASGTVIPQFLPQPENPYYHPTRLLYISF